MVTELFYSHIFDMKRGSFHMKEVSGICTSLYLDTDELKMALWARKVSRAGPLILSLTCLIHLTQ